ncbi:hypothetical protein [Chromobacterium violaceum]|uniref:hypothetical protein n=1 Tax=Chromobacterium violaceum TaxID=536 RepID=UPI000AF7DB36|nr:hypothetical protein [Chromobacterium violaceum]
MSRKRTARRHWQLPQGIPGMPVGSIMSPLADHCQTRSLKRMLTADRPPMDWTPRDVNELIHLSNTVAKLVKRHAEYATDERLATGRQLQGVLSEVKRRRREHGHYGLTGDEWKTLRRAVATLQSWLETVPTQRLFAAEMEVDREMVADDLTKAA